MAKVVVKSLKPKSRKKPESVTEKRLRDSDGKMKVVRSLDVRSETFASDFEYVFGKNVAKARRENTRVTGAPDAVIARR